MKPLTTGLAAKWLFKKQPLKSENAWIQYLKNNRRNDRNPPYKIPFTKISGEAYYLLKDLNEFFSWEKFRVKREIRNSRYAGMDKFNYELFYNEIGFKNGTDFVVTTNIYKDKPYVNLAFSSARVTFKLSVTEVRELVEDLQNFLLINK